MEEKKKMIVYELSRMKNRYKKRNVFMECLFLYLLQKDHFKTAGTGADFDRITKRYSMSDIIEFSKIGRILKEMKPADRVELLIDVNKELRIDDYRDYIIKNFS